MTHTTRDPRVVRWSRRSRRLAVGIVATLTLASCSSDDLADPAAEAAAEPTTTSTAPTTTTMSPPTTTTATTTTTTATTTTTDADDTDDAVDAASCVVGTWLLDGPQWVANSVEVVGEPVSYSSGSYVYTFSDDGTFDVAVDDFNIIIEGDDGSLRVDSTGSEQGTWEVLIDIADPPGLPQVFVTTTNVSVSQTGYMGGQIIPFGLVDQDQGLDGIGPVDCDAETMVIRGTVPLAIDYPFTRL